MFCDQCGQQIPADAGTCPACGAQLVGTPGGDPRGPGLRVTLAAILTRNRRGTAAAILGAWFNVPFVILLGALGALLGGIAGVVSGTIAGAGVLDRLNALLTYVLPLPVDVEYLLPTAAAQVGGILGGLLGMVSGAAKLGWLALAWPWQQLYAGDPMWPAAVALGQVVTAAVVGFLYVAAMAASEALRLRITGARPPSRREAEWLMPLFQEAGTQLGLTALPRLLVDDRREPNASAGIRHVVVNAGLLEQLNYDRDQFGAVLAHELAHWRAGDPIALAWSRGVALPLFLLYELADRLLRLSRSRPLHFVVRTLFWSVIVTVRYVVAPLQAANWRTAEFRADNAAAAAGYGPGLRAALTYIRHSFDGQRSGWDRTLLASHPATEQRLEQLETVGRRYALREDHPLTRALPGWTHRSSVEKGW